MKIKNKHILNTHKMLFDLKLKGTISRLRSRFNRLLQEHYITIIDPEEKELQQQYAIRDEHGKIIIKENGNFDVAKEYLNDMDILLNEEMHIDLNEANKEMLLTVASLFLDEELITVSGELAETHDYICEKFEKVIQHYESQN
ncbi:hypothetical protein [Lysinibacillus sp. BPa_S21]|uniref:hypothetical protein n=1 Tax=Lysinibacillus sp. BPa_S21 TaxID=2932478 RepID=UPI002011101B|nr:hypothetical protein [Lysinibacillus sp. BPa_S21]MCL1696250.1 hypothetical protein [Lysinibacillus sp. BPa_S21]